jgi:hypothetical protein
MSATMPSQRLSTAQAVTQAATPHSAMASASHASFTMSRWAITLPPARLIAAGPSTIAICLRARLVCFRRITTRTSRLITPRPAGILGRELEASTEYGQQIGRIRTIKKCNDALRNWRRRSLWVALGAPPNVLLIGWGGLADPGSYPPQSWRAPHFHRPRLLMVTTL